MSQVLIQQYLNQLQDLRKVSGTHHEMVVFPARRFTRTTTPPPRESRTHHEKQTFRKVIYENFYNV